VDDAGGQRHRFGAYEGAAQPVVDPPPSTVRHQNLRPASGGIDDDPGRHRRLLSLGLEADCPAIGRAGETGERGGAEHQRPPPDGYGAKAFLEPHPVDLPPGPIQVGERVADHRLVTALGAAERLPQQRTIGNELLPQAHIRQQPADGARQRLADPPARQQLAVKDQNPAKGARD
jgi:hypothetical protein